MYLIVCDLQLQRVECEIDVGAVFVTAGRQVALNHLDRVLGHTSAVFAGAFPVAIGDFGDNLTLFFNGLENSSDIEMPVKCALDTDFDIVEVDKYRDL